MTLRELREMKLEAYELLDKLESVAEGIPATAKTGTRAFILNEIEQVRASFCRLDIADLEAV